MKLKLSLTVLLVATTILTNGQDTAIIRRTPYKLTLAVDKKSFYEEEIKATPYVLPNNTVQLYPGETVFIEIEQEDGIIKSLVAVEQNIHPDKTLIINFSQTANKKIHENTMLKIQNPFKQSLLYIAKIFFLHHRKWVDTNVYPVEAGLASIEIWPDVIISIVLEKWEFKSSN